MSGKGNNYWKIFYNGIVPGNPVLVLLLGMCATLGTTSSAMNGLMMGLATAAVLVCSNVAISAVRNLVPDKVHIPAYIVIIASFVTMLQLAVNAWMPALNASLGLFIPLIVVNCILLGRAEAFEGQMLGGTRELLGTGRIFGAEVFPEDYGMLLFVLAPGAFIALGYIIAIVNKIRKTC